MNVSKHEEEKIDRLISIHKAISEKLIAAGPLTAVTIENRAEIAASLTQTFFLHETLSNIEYTASEAYSLSRARL